MAGLAAVIAGFADLAIQRGNANDRVAAGSAVEAVVVAKPRAFLLSGGFRVLDVRYSLDGQQYTATLGGAGFDGETARYSGLEPGDALTMYVDRHDPSVAATTSGLMSEGRWTFAPWFLWLAGASLFSWLVATRRDSAAMAESLSP
ncbi:hypothetical protein ACFQZ4_26480 [Catellatospora coxensis]|uniref:hypothetical protein n=1 Tax=Catellatospora coxensis TaxID=310354 RepID=UPI001942C4DD|nr:hypothetical protein [Catellatospora coxensis]